MSMRKIITCDGNDSGIGNDSGSRGGRGGGSRGGGGGSRVGGGGGGDGNG